jgi:NAD(P)-dependent dehydrogenase (short-subunit alcohol dehydrogenase family)
MNHTHRPIPRLAGKVAVITGATGGIGQAIARRFAAEGASLLLAGRNGEACRQLTEELRAQGTICHSVIGNFGDESYVDELADVARKDFGRVDVLMLNAGTISFAPACEMTTAEFDEMMLVNVKAPWLCVRALHTLLSDGASIVATASVSSHVVFPGEAGYCMSKAAVIQLVRSLAVELAPRVRVNALCPGIVGEAGMSHDAAVTSASPDDELNRNDALTPLGRPAALAEVASAALYLGSADSSFITGQSLTVDGGLTIPRVGF